MPINVVPQFLHGKFRYAVAPAGIPGTPGILGIPGIPEITNQFRKVNLRGSTSGSISSFASAPVPTGIPGIPGMLSMKKKRGENQRLTGEVAPRIPVVTPPPPTPQPVVSPRFQQGFQRCQRCSGWRRRPCGVRAGAAVLGCPPSGPAFISEVAVPL